MYIDGEDDYRNTLYHADAIILDRSAVMIEAAMLDVPVLLMKNDDYSEPMTRPVDEVCESFYQGTRYKDIVSFLEDFRHGIDNKKIYRKSAIDKNFPFNDGNCGTRIKNDIVKSLNESDDILRIVLYGTGEICKYYMKKQNWATTDQFEIIGVVDSSASKWGSEFYGHVIMSPDDLKKVDFDAIVITTEPHYFEIKKRLVYDLYFDERDIWRLDEFVIALQRLDV